MTESTKTVMMPRTLTAENGAKGLMSGEFYETTTYECHSCLDMISPDCHRCGGSGIIKKRIPVSWTTIKEIYTKAVEHLGT